MGQITLNLPDGLEEQIKHFGQVTNRDPAVVLIDAIEMMWPSWEQLAQESTYPEVTSLSDAEVIALAKSKMDPQQIERLGQLQAQGKATGLNSLKQFELLLLLQLYQIGQLRKSQAMAEMVSRGL